MKHQLIDSGGKMYVSETVNRQNAMTAQRFEHTTLKNKDNTPVRARRNGKTQTWARQPDKFRIPAKYGIRQYFDIDNFNAHDWVVVD